MRRHFQELAVFLLVAGAAGAATITTTLTVNASGSFSATGVTATGTASLSGVTNAQNGQFSATLALTPDASGNLSAPFTITFSAGALTGKLSIPISIISSAGPVTGSGTITGGTGSFAGWTGTFSSLTGTGSLSTTTGALTLTFTGPGTINTSGGGTSTLTPTITAVQDAVAYTSKIAQGSVFIVKGSNLAGTGFNQAQSLPLGTTLGGAKITFTPASGGTGTDSYMIYTYNQIQLAAILPSTVAPGNYNVTVTNGTAASAAFQTTVVAHNFNLNTSDATGSGRAVIQNFVSASEVDINSFTTGTYAGNTISPAHPGQTLIAYGTGLGPITSPDNVAGGVDLRSAEAVLVIVGGEPITPTYWGRYAPGGDQVNFVLPADVQTGCTVPFQISVNGALSEATFISIAPSATASACVSPNFTLAQLQNFDQGGTYITGGFSMIQLAETVASLGAIKIDSAAGGFTKYTGSQLAAIPPQQTSTITSGSCTIIQVSGSSGTLVSGSGVGLDAGTVTLNGPSGSNITNMAFTETNNLYSLSIGEEGLPTTIPGIGNGKIVAGTYTLSGAGGADVGKFSASLTLSTPLTVTGGLPATVTRSAGLPLAWTGGSPSDLVEIVGYAGTTTGSGTTAVTNATEFVCFSTAGAGGFTVPSSILTQLPAVSAAAIANFTGTSFLEVTSGVNPTTGNGLFTAPLTAGGTVSASFLGFVGTGNQPVYQ